MAAYEALWQTRPAAPFTVFGIPDEKNQKVHLKLAVPGMLNWLIYFNTAGQVKGLNDFPPTERPPVFLPFLSYHLMILLGLAFIGLALGGLPLWLWIKAGLFLKPPHPPGHAHHRFDRPAGGHRRFRFSV